MTEDDWERFESPHEHKVPAEALEQPKEWVGLSDEEIWGIANFLGKNKEWDYPVMFAKTIEQALKEKQNE